jgi:predicted metal-binding membrane protein
MLASSQSANPPRLKPTDFTRILTAAIVSVSALAWIGMVMMHEGLHTSDAAQDPAYAQFLADLPPQLKEVMRYCTAMPSAQGPGFMHWLIGWALMTVAMMLPPALPLVHALQRLTYQRQDSWQLIFLTLIHFILIWVVAGAALYGAGHLIQLGLRQLPALALQPAWLAGIAALLVGIYQFTPLKMACLTACRSPTSVIMTQWRSNAPLRSAACIGACYGAVCVGCCWALMLLSVLVGALMMPIMVVTAVIMMLERIVPSVRPLIPVQAALAIGVGLLLIVGTLPAGFSFG